MLKKKIFFRNIKLFLLIFIIALSFFVFKKIKAGSADNVSGWAWSENIGWISFNNTTGEGAIDYGVDIDSLSGVFSGYAWSENIGWISFNESDLTGCPVGTCQAKLDGLTNEVSGWARALNYGDGWDGWIRLRDTSYGVSWNSGNQEMEGWAWSDGIIGWISFNCVNQGVCATSDYKVIASFAGVDSDPPTTSIVADPSSVTTTWQNTDATATVSCSDTGSGCDTGTYMLKTYTSDPGSCSTNYGDYDLSSPQTISSHVWVCGAAKDLNGNAGFSDPIEYKVDQIEPNSQIQSPASGSWYANNFSLDTLDEDLHSGLDSNSCEYKVLSYDCYPPGPSCEYSTGWLNRVCNTSAQNITVGAGGNCPFEGNQSCWAYIRSQDNVGNLHSPSEGKGSIKYYNLDWTEPLVGEILPLIATQGVEQTFTASLNDPVGRISGCWFYIDGQFEKTANFLPIPCENGGDCTISVAHQFLSTGDYSVRFACRDAANNVGWGSPVTVSVSESHSPIITSLDDYSCYSTTPEQECTDQFTCCTELTTQTNCDVKFNISAYDPDGNPLTYTWDFDDGTPNSNDEDPSHHYTTANTYNVSVDVFDGTATTTDSISVVVTDPTVLVSLTADPSFGTDSLQNVDLRAIVGGSMYGTINYKFDCTNDTSWELEVSGQSIDDYTAVDLCNYGSPGDYTAKVFIERGGSAEDTANINVVASECTPGQQTNCTSPQGCSHTITCQEDSTWPSCPTDECLKDNTRSCGNCGEQICSSTCEWGSCTGEGECEPGLDCPDCLCPPDVCVGQDYYDYSDFGDCDAGCSCDTGIETGQPCEPTIYVDDIRCNQSPIADSLDVSPTGGAAPLDVTLTGSAHDPDGTISQYEFDFGDGSPKTVTSTNIVEHTYDTPDTYCIILRVQDNNGAWSETPEDCLATYTQEIIIGQNSPPQAAISCDASGCGAGSACNGSWIAYNRNCQFYFLNQSTDPNSTNPPDNNNDIIKSTWSIFYEGGTPWQDPYVICTDDTETPENEGMCDLLMPVLPASQNYYVTLTVEDVNGATDSYSKNFYVRKEVAADFQCSLDPEEGWQFCNGFVASEEEVIYFKDISIPSEGSTGVISWSWTFEDGTPSTSNLQNPSASFMNIDANSGTAILDVVDNVGRTDTEQYQLQITIPLPEWYEVAPF